MNGPMTLAGLRQRALPEGVRVHSNGDEFSLTDARDDAPIGGAVQGLVQLEDSLNWVDAAKGYKP